MLKQKIDTAALFASKKTEAQGNPRTLLTLNGSDNPYYSVEELSEDLLAIPEEGALWLDMSLFGSHDQVMTVARSFKLSPAAQNLSESRKQQSRLFRDGTNRLMKTAAPIITMSVLPPAPTVCFHCSTAAVTV